MAVAESARSLWARAPAWRAMVIGAAAATAMGALSLATSGGGAGGSAPAPTPPQQQTPGGAPQQGGAGGGGTAAAPPANCPQPGGAPPANTPPNVVRVAPAGPSQETLARITRFETLAGAADAEQRQGERCAQMARALDVLEPADLAAVRCAPSALAQYREATRCEADADASDRRLDALAAAHDAYAADRSAQVVARLAAAGAALTPFDRSRERANAMAETVRAAEAARDRIAKSDGRIAALDAAAQAAGAAGPGDAVVTGHLAAAAEAVDSFDASRMSGAQSRALEAGRDAVKAIAASDRRLAAVGPALTFAESASDGGQRLIDAVAALTPFDAARAAPDQAAAIETARTRAVSVAQETLVRAATGLDVTAASPVEHRRLSNLRSVIDANGGLPADADPQAAEAYRMAGVAAASLAESDRRIASLADAAEAWRRNPGPGLESAVRSAHDAIRPYDEARFDGASRDDLAALRSARDILDAMRDGLAGSERGAAPIFVAQAGASDEAALAAAKLRTALSRAGYRVVDSREASALVLEVGFLGEDRSSISIGASTAETSVVTLSMTGGWTYRADSFLRETVNGEGRAFSPAEVTENAIDDAVAELIAALDARVAE